MFFFFTATNPRIFTIAQYQNNSTQWDGLMYPQFGRYMARNLSINSMPFTGKHSVKSLSEAGFYHTGNHFRDKSVLITDKKEIPQKPNNVK